MNQHTGAPDQGGQRNREIRLGIEVLAIAHRLLDLIHIQGLLPIKHNIKKDGLELAVLGCGRSESN